MMNGTLEFDDRDVELRLPVERNDDSGRLENRSVRHRWFLNPLMREFQSVTSSVGDADLIIEQRPRAAC